MLENSLIDIKFSVKNTNLGTKIISIVILEKFRGKIKVFCAHEKLVCSCWKFAAVCH